MSPIRPHSPRPSDAQVQLIDDLGGPTKVAEIVNAELGTEFSSHTVSNWKSRGIPYAYRPCLIRAARRDHIEIPPEFDDEGSATADNAEVA